ncbi:MAG: FtsH protease activity modulator HflK [Deltaproteobacteria bacterium]|nr:MAG: FtsH protease activity modulator HflK [Deltaproteobacteria bacterium]
MQPARRQLLFTLVFWLSLLAVLFLWKGVVTIQPGENGILTTFSRVAAGPLEPGLHFIVPFVQQVRVIKLATIRKEVIISEAQRVRLPAGDNRREGTRQPVTYFLTADENLVAVDASVQYRIRDPRDFTFSSRHLEETVRDLARHVLATELLATGVDEVLSRGRAELLHRLHRRLQQECSRLGLGILVTSFLLADVAPPRAAIGAFQKVSDARAEAGQILSQAQAEALEAKARARGQASGQLASAASYRADKLASARGQAQRFSKLAAEYHRAPNLTRRRLALEAQARTLPRVKKVYHHPRRMPPAIHLAP